VIALLARLLGGGIAGHLRAAYEARLRAQTDTERLAAETTITQLEARQRALVAGGAISAIVQAAFAAPFAIYLWKLVVWDKVLGWGATDNLSSDLWGICGIIVGFYFLGATIRGVLR
jgi:glyoxylate carboligase